jgi:hypothetical protein
LLKYWPTWWPADARLNQAVQKVAHDNDRDCGTNADEPLMIESAKEVEGEDGKEDRTQDKPSRPAIQRDAA